MSSKSKLRMHDPSGKVIAGYYFGDVWFEITGPGKPRIRGYCNDHFFSEQELLTEYDNTGQGVDLYRVYDDGTKIKLRPR